MGEWKNEGEERGSNKREWKKEKLNLNVRLGQQDSLGVHKPTAKAYSNSLARCRCVV